MKESILQQKAFSFASNIVIFYEKLLNQAEEIKRMLISSLNTVKNKG